MEKLVNNPRFRRAVDSLPARNPIVNASRIGAKAVLFRKRITRSRRVVFPGISDAVTGNVLDVGNGKGEFLVKTLVTAVSPGTERGYYLDLPNFHQERPFIPGYSGCGIVCSNRTGNQGILRGTLVAGAFKHSSWNVVAADSLAVVPPGVTAVQAAFVTLGVIALCGVRAAGGLRGQSVAVAGQGIIGQLVNQLVRAGGAPKVVGIALGSSKREMAEKSGIDEFITLKDRKESLSAIAADVVIDSTGSLRGFEDALEMVKPGGRVVMLGSIPDYAEESGWAMAAVEKGIEVRGAHVRNLEAEGLTYPAEAARFLSLVAGKKVRLDHLITDVYKPKNAPEIYRRLASNDRNMVGVVIDWQSS